jgi:transposase
MSRRKNCCFKAVAPKPRPHLLTSGTAATKFYIAGLSIRVIGDILGWSENQVDRIIRRYVGRAAATKEAIRKLNEAKK